MLKKSFIIACVMALSVFFILTTGCAPEALTESAIDDQIDDALNGYLKPIAYGYIFSDGIFVIANTSGNFTVDHSAGTGIYDITINGVIFDSSDYMVYCTAYGPGSEVAKFSDSGDSVRISIYNAGVLANSAFDFVVYPL